MIARWDYDCWWLIEAHEAAAALADAAGFDCYQTEAKVTGERYIVEEALGHRDFHQQLESHQLLS